MDTEVKSAVMYLEAKLMFNLVFSTFTELLDETGVDDSTLLNGVI